MFNNLPETNLEKKMDEAVAWANAPRLTVTVAYPLEWGFSPQSGQNQCRDNNRPNEIPRRGYPFAVQFDPNVVYGDARWEAYLTGDLPADSSWYISSSSITETLKGLESRRLNAAEISFSSQPGNKTIVVVKTAKAVTLVPRTEPQPRIIKSNPPLEATSDNLARSPNLEITVTFAAPVDKGALKFASGYIEIWGEKTESGSSIPGFNDDRYVDMKDYFFDPPNYEPGACTLTIQSRGGIPSGLNIAVKLGAMIKSPLGGRGLEIPPFSYRTVESSLVIEKWQANYNADYDCIDVSWELPEDAGTMQPYARLQVNNGGISQLPLTGSTNVKIEHVPRLDSGGVQEGLPVSGVTVYTITLDLGEDPAVIRIWNIPGMSVSWDNRVVELNRNNFASGLQPDSRSYVLTEDIYLYEAWKPAGDNDTPFSGKLYGAGHTIQVYNGFTSAAYTGIFGHANNAEIRDLKVVYAGTTINGSLPAVETIILEWEQTPLFDYKDVTVFASYIGGIAGYLKDTSLANVVITGESGSSVFNIISSGNNGMFFGGITGFIEGSGKIENCYAGLSMNFQAGGTGIAFIGGIAGCAGISTGPAVSVYDKTAAAPIIENVTVAADVTAGNTGSGLLNIGGAIGRSVMNTVRNLLFARGTISVNRTGGAGSDICGGLAGQSISSSYENCMFSGVIDIPDTFDTGATNLGGIWGNYNAMGNRNPVAADCWTRGDIILRGNGNKYVGGVMGTIGETHHGDMYFINCRYEGGSITAEGSGSIYIGGFCGRIGFVSHFTDCRVEAGIITAETPSGEILAGGFAGAFVYTNEISGCYSQADLKTTVKDGINSRRLLTGGFLGENNQGTIKNCYASGNVYSKSDGSVASSFSGGFVGHNANGGKIIDCYTLGNVLAEGSTTTTDVIAGGITGCNSSANISRCFSAGTVTALTANTGGTVYTGGILGYQYISGAISNCAALGESVTAMGGGSRAAGRIYGYPSSNIGSNNYADKDMLVETSATHNDINPPPFNYSALVGITGPHGASASGSAFKNPYIWEAVLGFNSAGTYIGTPPWDFSSVLEKGYPVLAKPGGQ